MNPSTRIVLNIAFVAASLGALTTGASAETQWERNHPRRDQVNGRLADQNHRINQEVRSGQITHAQAQALRANDHTIRGEERGMASQDGGHITRTDQTALNQQLNANSRAIGK
jgi:hypothetical protein